MRYQWTVGEGTQNLTRMRRIFSCKVLWSRHHIAMSSWPPSVGSGAPTAALISEFGLRSSSIRRCANGKYWKDQTLDTERELKTNIIWGGWHPRKMYGRKMKSRGTPEHWTRTSWLQEEGFTYWSIASLVRTPKPVSMHLHEMLRNLCR